MAENKDFEAAAATYAGFVSKGRVALCVAAAAALLVIFLIS